MLFDDIKDQAMADARSIGAEYIIAQHIRTSDPFLPPTKSLLFVYFMVGNREIGHYNPLLLATNTVSGVVRYEREWDPSFIAWHENDIIRVEEANGESQ